MEKTFTDLLVLDNYTLFTRTVANSMSVSWCTTPSPTSRYRLTDLPDLTTEHENPHQGGKQQQRKGEERSEGEFTLELSLEEQGEPFLATVRVRNNGNRKATRCKPLDNFSGLRVNADTKTLLLEP